MVGLIALLLPWFELALFASRKLENSHKDKKYRPFCSKRCADLDLGNWFNESYSIPVNEINEEDIEELTQALEDQFYENEKEPK